MIIPNVVQPPLASVSRWMAHSSKHKLCPATNYSLSSMKPLATTILLQVSMSFTALDVTGFENPGKGLQSPFRL